MARKRSTLIRQLRNAPTSATQVHRAGQNTCTVVVNGSQLRLGSQVGESIVQAMQTEEPRAEGDPSDPHAGLTEPEYQELMSTLELALQGLMEEEERAAQEAGAAGVYNTRARAARPAPDHCGCAGVIERDMADMFISSLTLEQQEAELGPVAADDGQAAEGSQSSPSLPPSRGTTSFVWG